MFKKVQLKFVATTMSIVLVIFIAVLGSINLIMQSMMQRQSKVILSKIASNIKYDEKTSVFSFSPQEPMKTDIKEEKWELNPNQSTSQSTESTERQTQTVTEESSAIQTETKSESETSHQIITEDSNEIQTETETEKIPEPTKANITETQPEKTTQPPPTEEKTETTQVTTQSITEVYPPERPEFTRPERPEPFYPPYYDDDYYDDYYDDYDDDDDDIPDDDDYYERPPQGPFPNDDFRNYNYFYDEEPDDDADDIYDTDNIEQLSFKNGTILSDYDIIVTPLTVNENIPPMEKKPVEEIPPKTVDSIDYFVLMADASGNLLDIFNQDDLDTSLAQRYINSILNDGAITGMIGSLQFYTAEKNNGTAMVFTDKSAELEMLDNLIKTTLLIGSISFVLISILVIFLSRKSIEPVKRAFEKQKQFVSDASHELKTPLTIISANADVLAGEIGENKWLTYIQAQIERMSLLVNDLLNLTRLENNSADMTFSEFNLSQAVMNTALPFECQAFENHKKFDVDVEENITLTANERHCKQLFAIFIDNAIKYSDENGEVKVTLKKQGDKKIFSVYNTGSGIKDNEKHKIFERFYRSDDSRSRNTGGYGLGLAIAKSIIDYHKFKINIDNCEGKYIKFIITM